MRRVGLVLLVGVAAFVLNTAILFWSYQRLALPYLIEPEKTENLPRMLESVMATGLAAIAVAMIAAFLLRAGTKSDQK